MTHSTIADVRQALDRCVSRKFDLRRFAPILAFGDDLLGNTASSGNLDSLPNARLVVIEGRGQLAPIERSEEAAAALREWLGA